MKEQNINMKVSEDDLEHTLNNILILEKLYVLEMRKIYEIEKGITKANHCIMAISLNRGLLL